MLNIIKVSPIGLGCSGQGLDLALPAEGAEAVRAIVAKAFARLAAACFFSGQDAQRDHYNNDTHDHSTFA